MAGNRDRFEGFPAGDLRFVQVPDLFFTGLAPVLDDLAALKIVLHVLWLRQRGDAIAITRKALETDETLARSLATCGGDVAANMERGLSQAMAVGALLCARVAAETGEEQVFALNSQGGRHALSQLEAGNVRIEPAYGETPVVEVRPNIFALYENNIGLLSPILRDELMEADAMYPPDWIEAAFRLAAVGNVRKWTYIRAILERWRTEGKDDGDDRRHSGKGSRWYTDDEFEQFIKK